MKKKGQKIVTAISTDLLFQKKNIFVKDRHHNSVDQAYTQ